MVSTIKLDKINDIINSSETLHEGLKFKLDKIETLKNNTIKIVIKDTNLKRENLQILNSDLVEKVINVNVNDFIIIKEWKKEKDKIKPKVQIIAAEFLKNNNINNNKSNNNKTIKLKDQDAISFNNLNIMMSEPTLFIKIISKTKITITTKNSKKINFLVSDSLNNLIEIEAWEKIAENLDNFFILDKTYLISKYQC